MRKELIKLILKNKNKNDYFLTADLGFSVLEELKKKLKEKFINVGVSENNMMLLAIGLASSLPKYKIFVYSISSFMILRNIEIIRNFIYNDNVNNIRLIGVGSGASYSEMGKTHYNFEDINILNSFKNILILNPANKKELNFVFKKFNESLNCIYYRINKNVKDLNYKFIRKKNIFVKKGKRKNIISSGSILNYLPQVLGEKKFLSSNIISLPILDLKYFDDIKKFLINDDVYCITDAIEPIIFYKLKKKIPIKKFKIFEPKLNNIKRVGSELDVLNQSGLKKFFYDY